MKLLNQIKSILRSLEWVSPNSQSTQRGRELGSSQVTVMLLEMHF